MKLATKICSSMTKNCNKKAKKKKNENSKVSKFEYDLRCSWLQELLICNRYVGIFLSCSSCI